jgi:hypothetical protein
MPQTAWRHTVRSADRLGRDCAGQDAVRAGFDAELVSARGRIAHLSRRNRLAQLGKHSPRVVQRNEPITDHSCRTRINWVGGCPVRTADADLDHKTIPQTKPTFLNRAEVRRADQANLVAEGVKPRRRPQCREWIFHQNDYVYVGLGTAIAARPRTCEPDCNHGRQTSR